MAIVQDLAKLRRDKLVAQAADVAVERQALNVHVCDAQDGCAGALVAPTRLDADEAVLDNVDPPDAVLPREGVEREENLHGVGPCLVPRSNFEGRPVLNSIVICSGTSGADSGDAVSFHMSVGGVVSGSSRIPAS